MKPKLGSEVYVIWDGCQIYLEGVGYIGEDSFIVNGYEYKTDAEYYYDDYNITWFKSFEKAKKVLFKELKRKYPNTKFHLEQDGDDVWEAIEDE